MSYHHLSINERTKIETLFQLGFSARAIGRHIQRHHSTVSRELNRFNRLSSEYRASNAQLNYEHKRLQSKPDGKFTKSKAQYLTQTLAATWSPEQIEGRLKETQPTMVYPSKQSIVGFTKVSSCKAIPSSYDTN